MAASSQPAPRLTGTVPTSRLAQRAGGACVTTEASERRDAPPFSPGSSPGILPGVSAPLAYFLTWTGYGQRLHGDERGSVDLDHNRRGTPLLPVDELRRSVEQASMTGPAVTLTLPMRAIVDSAIVELATERGWHLLARNARPTHVHVVVNCRGGPSPEAAMGQLKARATKDLRLAGLVPQAGPVWTRHGSTRWINHYDGLYAAIAYVNDWQSGPNREILEEHKRALRERIETLKAWLRSKGLPEDGRGVVAGESEAERRRRLRPRENAGGSSRQGDGQR
jgi:REP element-mobilizing transposase RayT